jgi:hypothetical protein
MAKKGKREDGVSAVAVLLVVLFAAVAVGILV